MSDVPNLTPEQVARLIPQASDIERVDAGGQKVVFKGTIAGEQYALLFAKVPELPDDLEDEEVFMSDVVPRARREIETLRECRSRHMVKLGPVGLDFTSIDDQNVLYFSEEYVIGRDLRTVLRTDGRFRPAEIVRLALQITDAIQELWRLRIVHRDIKPANIMRRDGNNEYVLLDAGLAFDVVGESLSMGPMGTAPYFSPEQFDFANRRSVLDFRSDLFSLGVTMYQLVTGQHPFWSLRDTSASLFDKITNHIPVPPSTHVPDFPEELEKIILRMLAKSPHLRYRRCQQLIDVLTQV